jgi:hypothetical protein
MKNSHLPLSEQERQERGFMRRGKEPIEALSHLESAWSFFWKRCSEDEDSRMATVIVGGILVGLFLLLLSMTTCYVASTMDDLEIEVSKTEYKLQQDQMLQSFVAAGVNPLVGRCALIWQPANQCRELVASLTPEEKVQLSQAAEKIVQGAEETVAAVEAGAVLAVEELQDNLRGLDFGGGGR